MKVRTRFAPSPTGNLHVGGARTALFNWLFARHHGGEYILRIEDTDVERSTKESADGILEGFKWLGLDWDEGPFYQSERLDIYAQHLDMLKASGNIYPAFDSKEELDAMREKAIAEKRNPIYDRRALKLSPEEVQAKIDAGEEFVWRFKVPDEGFTEIPELLMGGKNCKLKNDTIGDFVITRPSTKDKPGMPLYNFVCTVDDALMEITHVIRGVEHLPNAAKQVLLYNAMGYTTPQFIHLPLIMKNGKKMSKRDVDADGRFPVSVEERRDLGYMPEAMLNFFALLGFSLPGEQEIASIDELIKGFDTERLSKSNANFDEDKLFHFNSHYMKLLSDDALLTKVKPFLEAKGMTSIDDNTLTTLVGLEKERCRVFSEFPEALSYFYTAPTSYEEKGVSKFFNSEEVNAADLLTTVADRLNDLQYFTHDRIEEELHSIVEDMGLKFGKFGPVIRLALTGRMRSPGLAEMMVPMGKDESVNRLRTAASLIQQGAIQAA